MQRLKSFMAEYRLGVLALRILVLSPFILLYTIGQWAESAGVWIDRKFLPHPRKEG